MYSAVSTLSQQLLSGPTRDLELARQAYAKDRDAELSRQAHNVLATDRAEEQVRQLQLRRAPAGLLCTLACAVKFHASSRELLALPLSGDQVCLA